MRKTQAFIPSASLFCILLLAIASTLTGCPTPLSDGTELPEERYYQPLDPNALPEDTQLITNEEFAEWYRAGQLQLSGPEAEREAEELELAQDEEDLQTIDDFESEHGLKEKCELIQLPGEEKPTYHCQEGDRVLPPLGRKGPNTKPLANGSFEVAIRGRGRELIEITTESNRTRLRTAAEAIRTFRTKKNQTEIFTQLSERVPPQYKARLELPETSEIEKLTPQQILILNDRIASNWTHILAAMPSVPAPLTVPPNCDGSDEGSAVNWGSDSFTKQECRHAPYSTQGLMMNYQWPGKEAISCVKNQARRGTCSAFAAVSALESIVYKKHGKRLNLSEQALYARQKWAWGNGSDYGDGFSPTVAFTRALLEGYVIPFEKQWPYNQSKERLELPSTYVHSCDSYTFEKDKKKVCSNTNHQSPFLCTYVQHQLGICGTYYPDINPQNEGVRIAAYPMQLWDPANRDLSVKRAAAALAINGAEILWSHSVQPSVYHNADSGGFVQFLTPFENEDNGSHVVHLVGVITNEKLSTILPSAPQGAGGGYFIAKNSWGTCFGDKGFFYVPFASVRAYTTGMLQAPPAQ